MLTFPEKGVDVRFSLPEQPEGTTSEAQNVRLFEALTHRPRGGSRAGISKYVADQVSGTNPIQHLNLIVTASGEALGWSFEGRDMADPNQLGVDFGPTGISNAFDGPAGGGGGGYQPSVSFQSSRRHFILYIATGNPDLSGVVLDDAMEVYLNGNLLGALDFPTGAFYGRMWRTTGVVDPHVLFFVGSGAAIINLSDAHKIQLLANTSTHALDRDFFFLPVGLLPGSNTLRLARTVDRGGHRFMVNLFGITLDLEDDAFIITDNYVLENAAGTQIEHVYNFTVFA